MNHSGQGGQAQEVLEFRPPVCGPGCFGGVYTVQPGDTMFFIARRFGVSLDALIRCNPQIPNPNLIFPGQQLCLPSGAAPVCSFACQGGIHIVQPGETMFSIADKLGVPVDALIACNPQVPNPNLIFPGQALCTPTGATPQCGPGCQGGIYTVIPGDTMFLIAARLNVPLDRLIACNPQIPNPNLIFPGQKLCIPSPVLPPLPCCLILRQVTPIPGSSALGVALVRQLVLPPPNVAVTIAAHDLPDPASLGAFDAYEGVVAPPGTEFRFRLFATPEAPPTWAGTRTGLPALPATATVLVRPFNTATSVSGPAQLANTLANCRGA